MQILYKGHIHTEKSNVAWLVPVKVSCLIWLRRWFPNQAILGCIVNPPDFIFSNPPPSKQKNNLLPSSKSIALPFTTWKARNQPQTKTKTIWLTFRSFSTLTLPGKTQCPPARGDAPSTLVHLRRRSFSDAS